MLKLLDVKSNSGNFVADTYRKFKEKRLAENPTQACAKVMFCAFVNDPPLVVLVLVKRRLVL